MNQNIFNGERQGMMVLLKDENETKVGGMFLIPKSSGSNGVMMDSMKVLTCQLHREAFLKSFTIASPMNLHEAESPIGSAKRGLPFLHSARNASIHFKPMIKFFSPLQLRGRRPTRRSSSAREVSCVPSTTTPKPRSPMRPPPS